MKNKPLFSSIVNQQCPSCRSANMFKAPVYSRKFHVIHDECPNCAQVFEPEPGFYTGAMYVSYAIQVAFVIALLVVTTLFNIESNLLWYFSWIGGLMIVLLPLIYRLSRSIWAHMFIPYRGEALIKVKK